MIHEYRAGLLAALFILGVLLAPAAIAADRAALDRDALRTYGNLVARVPAAKALAKDAPAVLVFPKITKAGLVVGGQYGEGVLLRGGKPAGYYSTAGASYGLQAGAQQYGYAMFFMNDRSLGALDQANGFEVGVGPSVVVVDEGMAKSLTSVTAKQDVYAFIFGQKGLMAGISKATRSRNSPHDTSHATFVDPAQASARRGQGSFPCRLM